MATRARGELSEHSLLRARSHSPYAEETVGPHHYTHLDYDKTAGDRSRPLERGARGCCRTGQEPRERVRKRRNPGQQRRPRFHSHRPAEGTSAGLRCSVWASPARLLRPSSGLRRNVLPTSPARPCSSTAACIKAYSVETGCDYERACSVVVFTRDRCSCLLILHRGSSPPVPRPRRSTDLRATAPAD